jgi:hypothetical protein
MTRSVAFRAFLFFTACAVLFAVTGFLSQVPVAEVLFLISASLCAVTLFFALATPAYAPVPVRVRRKR